MLKEGKVPMSTVDDKASRILRLIFRTAMNRQKPYGSLTSEEHYQAAREIGNGPVGVGTRWAAPMSLPFSSGITRPIAFAAPVEFGTMLTAAARERRRSPLRCGPSSGI